MVFREMKHCLNLFAVKLIETQKHVSLFVSKTHDETRFLYTHNLTVYVTQQNSTELDRLLRKSDRCKVHHQTITQFLVSVQLS